MDERILEFHHESILLDIFRFGIYCEYSQRVLLLDVFLRSLGHQLFRFRKLYFFGEAVQHAESVGLHVLDIQIERIRLWLRIIHPDFKTVLLKVELSYEFLGRYAFDPD